MSEQDTVEVTLDEVEKTIARKDALVRLHNNDDFKDVILKGYLDEEAIRLASMSGIMDHPGVSHEAVMSGVKGIGVFTLFLQNVMRAGNVAENELEQYRKEMEENRYLEEDEVE